MKTKHVPIRECIGCGRKFPKANLVRVVKNEAGIFVDASGKQHGRGAYLCGEAACTEKLIRQRRLNRAFKQPVDEAVYQNVAGAIEAKKQLL